MKNGIIGGVFTAMVAVAGYGAYNIYSALEKPGPPGADSPRALSSPVSSEPPTAQEVDSAATAFLAAWQHGDTQKAADLTDSPTLAVDSLNEYKDAHVTPSSIKVADTTGAEVAFHVDASITYQGVTKPWRYDSSLTAVRGDNNQVVVGWTPAVLVPALGEDGHLTTGQAKATELEIDDVHGKPMDLSAYPSLADITGQLRSRYADKLHGTPGIETYVSHDDGGYTTLVVLRKGSNAKLATTLDPDAQQAAEKAVGAQPNSGVSVVDADTGGIMAVAFNPPSGDNLALQSLQAPGSTFKVVTATALLDAGDTPQTPSQCVDGYAAKGGRPYHNVTKDNRQATLEWDFANSCNTGFIRLSTQIGPSTLQQTGRTYYGLGATWYTGVTTSDGNIPVGQGDELTSDMIGQGKVLMTPLNMASVSATVVNGRFHQPTLLRDTGLIDKRAAIAASPLPGRVRQDLMAMMHTTVTSGTAYAAMHTFGGTVGAKTGSAENGTGAPNGWFTAYHGHVAAAAMVLNGGEGGDTAGPIVAAVLAAAS
jgi:hypothetical protein